MGFANQLKKGMYGAGNLVKSFLHGSKTLYGFTQKAFRHWKVYLTVFFCGLYLAFAMLSEFMGPVDEVIEYIGHAGRTVVDVVKDTPALFQFVMSAEGQEKAQSMVYITHDQMEYIIGRVNDYNMEMNKEVMIPTTKRVYRGDIESIDYDTGEVVFKEVEEEELEKIPTMDELLEEEMEKDLSIGIGDTQISFIQIGAAAGAADRGAGFRSLLNHLSMLGINIITSEDLLEEKKENTITDEIIYDTVNRGKMDQNAFGGSIFDADWPVVVALSTMVLTHTEEELTDDIIDRLLGLYEGTYLYLDDCIEDDNYDSSFERCDEAGKAYRLEIVPYGDTCEVIKHPAIAPILYANSLYTYQYEYEEVNGNIQLTKRTCYYSPARFVQDIKRIIPDFEEDYFIEVLLSIPGCQIIAEAYRDFLDGKYNNYEGQLFQLDCNLVGVRISNSKIGD